jgi:2-amino-4-hydroxy-6-hydroxymethyldihydropteridine diphosphokinase
MATVYIAIGSNLGDRRANCERAIESLLQDGVAKNVIISKWYETEALAEISNSSPESRSPKYINGVVKIETGLAPRELMAELQKIEAALGRVRTGKKWEDRTIDLDILLYDDLIIDEPDLKIPHTELHKRMFVLEPLCDIEPALLHPIIGKTIAVIASERQVSEAIQRTRLMSSRDRFGLRPRNDMRK